MNDLDIGVGNRVEVKTRFGDSGLIILAALNTIKIIGILQPWSVCGLQHSLAIWKPRTLHGSPSA